MSAKANILNVLVLSSDTEMCRSVEAALSDTCRVVVAADTDHVLKIATSLKPEIIFLDLTDAVGLTTLSSISADAALDYIPVIVVCSELDRVVEEALAARVQDYILKPFSQKDFSFRTTRFVERLHSQMRDEFLLRSLDEGFCIIKVLFDEKLQPIDYRFLETNRAFEVETGLVNAKGKLMRDIAPQHEQHWFDIYGRVALTGESVRFEEQAVKLKRWFAVYACRVGAPDNHCLGVFFKDITKQKEAEATVFKTRDELAEANRLLESKNEDLEWRVSERTKDLQLARDMAINANELKSQFVASISHEIRTPMAGILGLSELLVEEVEGDAKMTAETILESSSRLMSVVNDLLDMSKLEANRVDIVEDVMRVDEIVAGVISTLSALARKKSIQLNYTPSDGEQQEVLGDANLLRQVLHNIIQNAIKFTDEGSVSVKVVVANTGDNNLLARFDIVDTGCGISHENQKKLFKMFVQVDGTDTRRHGGTGLGLFLAKKLVTLMHGDIGLVSAPQVGSTFWFEIPLKIGES